MSDTRRSEFVTPVPLPPLFDFAAVKDWFALPDSQPDTKLRVSMGAVSKAIRDYTGRVLTKGEFTETFVDVISEKSLRYLRETPVVVTKPARSRTGVLSTDVPLLNSQTGLVRLPAGPVVQVTYTAGYDPVPEDLQIVFMELLRMQMAMLGATSFGSSSMNSGPQEKAVWVGTLKVEYAVSATTEQAKASGAGGITAAALAPWSEVLDYYRTSWVAT